MEFQKKLACAQLALAERAKLPQGSLDVRHVLVDAANSQNGHHADSRAVAWREDEDNKAIAVKLDGSCVLETQRLVAATGEIGCRIRSRIQRLFLHDGETVRRTS